eukprot:TRINITY_DN5062_c0_g4_i1.p1 TRINITY_DN5062_c0_g4~~TRINITY_DN5062_c0_g4_i1.p1  ORF type:complete len:2520 (+),score=346.34 TRINITY_DN5062_c0_g4_i1:70-7629(+)
MTSRFGLQNEKIGEDILNQELANRIGKLVYSRKELGAFLNQEQVAQEKLLQTQSDSLLRLSANKLDIVSEALVSVHTKFLKSKGWAQFSETKQNQARQYILDLLSNSMAYAWNEMKNRFKKANNWDPKEVITELEKVLPAPLPGKVASDILDIVCDILLKGGNHQDIRDSAGRLLFQLSASNYESPVLAKIGFTISDEVTTPLNLIEYFNLNKSRLGELVSRFTKHIDMKQGVFKKAPSGHWLLLARVLTKAIWNWIDHYPMEFVSLCQSGTRLSGSPDVLFDTFAAYSSKNKKINFWELETMLLILCPDIMLKVALGKGTSKETAEKEKLLKALSKATAKGKNLADNAAVCYVNICKASTFVAKSKENGLRFLVPKIEPALQGRLFSPENVKTNTPEQVKLMTDCLVASFRLSPRKILNSLCTEFLKKEYPPVFKMTLVSTFQTIVDEGAILPDFPTISHVYSSMAQNLRDLFQEYVGGVRKYEELKEKTDRKAVREIERISYDIKIFVKLIKLFNSAPNLPLYPAAKSDAQTVEATKDLLNGLVYCASRFSLEDLSSAASDALRTLHHPSHIAIWGSASADVCASFWNISCSVNKLLADVLVQNTALTMSDIRKFVSLLKAILEQRNAFLAKQSNNMPKDLLAKIEATSALEAALLIHICNTEPEVVAQCTSCFGLLCDEVDIISDENPKNGFVANYEIYRNMSNVGAVFQGRMAQQRAVRLLLRRVQSTEGNFVAWRSVFVRWETVTDEIKKVELERMEKEASFEKKMSGKKAKGPAPIIGGVPDTLLRTWNHLSGFLFSAAGVALTHDMTVEVQARKGTVQQTVKAIDNFMQAILVLIVHKSPAIRETSTELAGSTMSPAAYTVLFNHISKELQKHFGTAGQIKFSQAATQLTNQTISIVKHILELPQDSWTASDLGKVKCFEELMDKLLRYSAGLEMENSLDPFRIKIKMCGCLCAMMKKHRHLGFKNEFVFRQKTVETVMEWISDFSEKAGRRPPSRPTPPANSTMRRGKTNDPMADKDMVIQELDTTCVKTISSLLEDLPLIKDDEQEVEISALGKYFQFFTRLLTRTTRDKGKKAKKAEYTVDALSNLLSANIDSALDYFVTMGYHDDLETRAAFLKVLSTLLNQGTEFDVLEGGEKYDKLVDLLLDSSLEVVMGLCSVIQITEADTLAALLVRIFESNDKTLKLLKKAIEVEVNSTETPNTLFRRNSIATKLLASYTKLIGKKYLKDTLGGVLQGLIAQTPPMELDPQRMPKGQNREVNIANTKNTAMAFLSAIQNSVPNCPLPFRMICRYLKEEVGKRFPGSEHSAIGGFIYLRYLCPAIVAPDGFGLVQSQALSAELRRGLILVTKALQNLANKVKFTKEPYMEEMNEFIEGNMDSIGKLFDTFATVSDDEAAPSSSMDLSEDQKEEDLAHIHYLLGSNVEKIRKVLTSVDARERGSDTYLRLTIILSQLGQASEPTAKKKFGATTFTAGKTNKTTTEFMRLGAHLDISSIVKKKIFFKQGLTKDKRPVYYFIARRFDLAGLMKQKEYFIYHVLKTIEPDLSKKFVLILDLSHFSLKKNEVPTLMLTKLQKVAPQAAFGNLERIYILYCNHDFKTYSKKIKKLIMPFFQRITLFSSVRELYDVIPEPEVALPASTLAIENDVKVSFNVQLGSQKEVILRITSDLFHIVTGKPERVFGVKLQTKMIDLYHIGKLQDYGMRGTDEVFVKYENVKMIVFRCQDANRVVKELKACKTRWTLAQRDISQKKRSFRPSEVPGTLLFMSLLNLGNTNHVLREEAYRLLSAMMAAENLSVQDVLWDTPGLCISKNNERFLELISKRLSESAGHMTLDFLGEAIHGFEKIQSDLLAKQMCLTYIQHWIPNLSQYIVVNDEPDRAEKLEKTKHIISSLIDYTIKETSMTGPAVLAKVWQAMGACPDMIPCVLDIALSRATKGGQGSLPLSVVNDIAVALASQNQRLVFGDVISRLLNALEQSNSNTRDEIYDDIRLWPKIATLLRILLALSFDNSAYVGQYLPEILYLVLMLFGMGKGLIRATVHGILINTVHNLFISVKQQGLRVILSQLNQQKSRVLFGLGGVKLINISAYSKPRETEAGAAMSIHNAESVAATILDVLNAASVSGNCVGSNWHARLLSLITRTAWTSNATLRPRAIVALGVMCNHPSLVTDTLLGKVLGTLMNVLGTVGQKLTHDLPLSYVICITKLFEHVPKESEFFKPMFWIAMLLLQVDESSLFAASLNLMSTVLQTLDFYGCFDNGVVSYCMSAREQGGLDSFLTQADEVTGLNFRTSFSFAVTGHLLKGLRTPETKTATARVLSSLIDISAKNSIDSNLLGYLAALLPVTGEANEHIKELLLSTTEGTSLHQYLFTEQMLPDTMSAVLLFTLLVTLLKSSDVELEQLFIYQSLCEGVLTMPEAFPVVYAELIPKMKWAIQNSQNQEIINACLSIMKSIFSDAMTDSNQKKLDKNYLKDNIRFQGLIHAGSFSKPTSYTDTLVKIVVAMLKQVLANAKQEQ